MEEEEMADSPYGMTVSAPNGMDPNAQQLVNDTYGIAGAGSWLRHQYQNIFYAPATFGGTWNFAPVDDIVSRANAKGINLCLPLQFKTWGQSYLQTRDACFNIVTGGSSTALYMDPYVPASQPGWNYVLENVISRYNGTVNSPSTGQPMIVNAWQIGNEEFDTFAQTGCNRDMQGTWLGQTAEAIIQKLALLKHPSSLIGVCAVRKTPSGALAHINTWMNNLFSNMPTNLGLLDFVDYHYYRDDNSGATSNDPTTQYPAGTGATLPSVATEVAAILAVASNYPTFTGKVWNGETGWHLYSDDTCCSDPVNCGSTGGCCSPVDEPTYSDYLLKMAEGNRVGGAGKILVYTINPLAKVHNFASGVCPSARLGQYVKPDPDSIKIDYSDGLGYRATQVYTDLVAYAAAHPLSTWPAYSGSVITTTYALGADNALSVTRTRLFTREMVKTRALSIDDSTSSGLTNQFLGYAKRLNLVATDGKLSVVAGDGRVLLTANDGRLSLTATSDGKLSLVGSAGKLSMTASDGRLNLTETIP